jgi:hypothetical protein
MPSMISDWWFNRYALRMQDVLEDSLAEVVIDKSHPLLWRVYELMLEFPNARFLHTYRDPVDSVASMSRHHGVLTDLEYANGYEVGNRWMGIYGVGWYTDAPVVKMTHKWLSHRRESLRWHEYDPGRHLIVNFKDMVQTPIDTQEMIASFLGIDPGTEGMPVINLHAVGRGEATLHRSAVRLIKQTLEDSPWGKSG